MRPVVGKVRWTARFRTPAREQSKQSVEQRIVIHPLLRLLRLLLLLSLRIRGTSGSNDRRSMLRMDQCLRRSSYRGLGEHWRRLRCGCPCGRSGSSCRCRCGVLALCGVRGVPGDFTDVKAR